MRRHPLYKVWDNMKSRCLNPDTPYFHNYGGRGVSVCTSWLMFLPFYRWAKSKWREGLELDRRDNNGNYEPSNCRFVSHSLNSVNQRKRKTNTSGYTGIHYNRDNGKYRARLAYKATGGSVHLGYHDTMEAAVAARNNFIIKHNLPHKIQDILGSASEITNRS